jgi:hypothetical protein
MSLANNKDRLIISLLLSNLAINTINTRATRKGEKCLLLEGLL